MVEGAGMVWLVTSLGTFQAGDVFEGAGMVDLLIPDTPWDCHICRSIDPPGTTPTDRQSYGSPMGRVWEL